MTYSSVAQKVIQEEARGLTLLAQNIPQDFSKVVNKILTLSGRVVVSGIGKSGYIARKIAASLASTGTPALYMHPAEASHGDLGMIAENDIVLLLSNSGETSEILNIIGYCKRFEIEIIGMTMKSNSTIAEAANYVLNIPVISEVSMIDAPTTSALMMLALGDALMISLYEQRGFTKDDFKVFHPGGKIGANLLRVSDLMIVGDRVPIVHQDTAMSETLIIMTQKGLGCTAVVDDKENLIGIITDGDLRRHMDHHLLQMPAKSVMSANPKTIRPEIFAREALSILNHMAITSLLVTDNKKIMGMIHVHDILRAGIG